MTFKIKVSIALEFYQLFAILAYPKFEFIFKRFLKARRVFSTH